MPFDTLFTPNPLRQGKAKAVFSNMVDGVSKKKESRAPFIKLFMADNIGELKPPKTKDIHETKKNPDGDVFVLAPTLSMFKKRPTSKDHDSASTQKSSKDTRFTFSSTYSRKSNKDSSASAQTRATSITTLVFGSDEQDTGKKKRRWTSKPKSLFVTTQLIERPPTEVRGSARYPVDSDTADVQDSVNGDKQHLACLAPRAARSLWKWSEGRKYHDVPGLCYPMPVDDDEMNRLHMQHHLLRMVQQGNYLAPIKDSLVTGKVLDVGCGPGIWVLEMAAEFPTTHIVGVDVAESYFPSKETRPPNTAFHYVNVHHGLPFQDGTFDFCHQRQMSLAVHEDRWPDVVSALLRVTKPGGSVQLLEQVW
ncbi:hypothetical protein BC936DRAFT_142761 [Jimgerdemannia flammicorona]|uniref:Methyltransferase domain-containing protein n=1 Tax=Jimgerdemannia flammicorona TaxID=994334 RepID=A0A433DEU7_9FUNG|nr:hypothetical protein BC936DRAFT_142761 [Jimgerdemannia flammicorona]